MPRSTLRPPDPRRAAPDWPQTARPLSIPERAHLFGVLGAGALLLLGLLFRADHHLGSGLELLIVTAVLLLLANAAAYAAIGVARDRGRRPRESRASLLSAVVLLADAGVGGAVGWLIGLAAIADGGLPLIAPLYVAIFSGPFSWALLRLRAAARPGQPLRTRKG